MTDLAERIVAVLASKKYKPVKPKKLARQLGIDDAHNNQFRRVLRDLVMSGRAEFGPGHVVRPSRSTGLVTGTLRRTSAGVTFVRRNSKESNEADIFIPPEAGLDAAPGDEVQVRLTQIPKKHESAVGEIVRVTDRRQRNFVGTYFERDGEALVRVDGTEFRRSVNVGDPGAKGAKPGDLVVIEMLQFPTSPGERGLGVITKLLGERGQPGVDLQMIFAEFDLSPEFPEAVLAEARLQAERFSETELDGREDFTGDLVLTIDPVDARDFDDAVSLTRDEQTGEYHLTVHVADVGHFAPPGSALDREARKRATSVYLPQCVVPMFPEIISNGLASLQEGRLRYVKSVVMTYNREGIRTHTRFANGAIRVRKRFSYEQVQAYYLAADARESSMPLTDEQSPTAMIPPDIAATLLRMRELAMILRGRRFRRGALELIMPETVLEFDDRGQVIGGHFATHDTSHQVIEEFMLAANEAVAEQLHNLKVAFLRRVHAAPHPIKLHGFTEFVRHLGYKVKRKDIDRFSLQKILEQAAGRTERQAVHYAFLRSLKQATYSPEIEGHYALASEHYCHFTSPIRRYPDLTVHRLLGTWLKVGRVSSDFAELKSLGEHCSKQERQADLAERELTKLKMLQYLSTRIGLVFEGVITSVMDYGFFAQSQTLPFEGLVHVRSLANDYFFFDEDTMSLLGRSGKYRYRLGDQLRLTVVKVDVQKRLVDLEVVYHR